MSNPDELSEDQIRLELLDSGSGRVVQMWVFPRSEVISIGRSPENSVVIQDPYVSRLHADLQFVEGGWRLTNRGRHGILLDGITMGESSPIQGVACFQLGSLGPTLRVREGKPTQAHFDTTIIAAPAGISGGILIDQERIRREVEGIAETPYFRELKQVRKMRAGN